MLVWDQYRFMNLTVVNLVASQQDYYELEGWLYYGIAFYKDNLNKINFPYYRTIVLNNKKDYIILSIDLISLSNDLDKFIEISVFKYIDSKIYKKLNCQLSLLENNKLQIKKIY